MLCTVYVLRHCIKQKKGLTFNVKPFDLQSFNRGSGEIRTRGTLTSTSV